MHAEELDVLSESQCPFSVSSNVRLGAGSGKRAPLINSIPFIGPVREFTGDVVPFLVQTRKEYGDIFRMRLFGAELTCLCGPDAIALMENDDVLCTTKSMKVLKKAMGSRLPMTFDGPQHKVYRKAHSSFLNRRLERARRDEIVSCLDQQTEKWQPGHRFDALKEAQSQTVQMLSQILNREPFPFSKEDLSTVIHTLFFATYGRVPMWLALNNPKYKTAATRMQKHFLSHVRRVQADPELIKETMVGQYLSCPPPEGTHRWEDDDLKIVPLMAYLAGFDTVASASGFLLYRLLSNPQHLQKVRDEYQALKANTDGYVDPMDQKFLRASFQETVRINPPGALVIRYAAQDFQYGGYTIRKGDEVIIQISLDHLDEELFPNPTHYDPSRFLVKGASELKRHVLAFGSGAHRCTGAMMGPLITQTMVSYWVNNYDLKLVPRHSRPKVVARPFTQPLDLKVEVVGPRSVV